MSQGSGGGGRKGRSGGGGGGGQPMYGPGGIYPNAGSQPRPGDTKMTTMMRENYGDGKQGVVVSTTQSHGETHSSHALGEITLHSGGAIVVGTNGKRYNYSSKNMIKALQHWEKLGGIK